MADRSRIKNTLLAVLCLGLIVWGLTDVRGRAHFDPAFSQGEALGDHRTDLTVFTEAGAAFFDGRDPYQVANPRGWMYLYPPLFAIVISPLRFLEPQWQGVVWYFMSLAMVWGCYRETIRLLRYARVEEFTQEKDARRALYWIGALSVAAVLIPTLDCLQRGQVGLLILYLMLLGVRWVLENQSWHKAALGGIVLALPVAIKIIPVLPVFFLLFLLLVHRLNKAGLAQRPFRFLSAGAGIICGLVLFFLVVPSVFIGWQSNLTHLSTWSRIIGNNAVEPGVEDHFSNPRGPRNQSLGNALYHTGNQIAFWLSGRSEPNPWLYNETAGRWMISPPVTKAVLGIRILLVLLLIPVAWRRDGSPLDRLAAFGLACVVMLIASPVSRGHYFMLELPAVLFGSLWVLKYCGSRKAVLFAGVPAALSLLHYAFITFPQIFGFLQVGTLFMGTLGIGTSLWYCLGIILLMRGVVPTLNPEEGHV